MQVDYPHIEEDQRDRIAQIISFARTYSPDRGHDEQVAKNALQLFDQLSPLHGLPGNDRFLLHAACILHDIGWSRGDRAHNKSGARIVRRDRTLPLTKEERQQIALLVRYHRKELPSSSQRRFAALKAGDKKRVAILSSILRIADGLDRSHQSRVEAITVTIRRDRVIIRCHANSEGYSEREYAMARADLFTMVFSRTVEIDWKIAG